MERNPTLTNPDLEDVVRAILAVCEPAAVILFGSYARGNFNEDSDIDLAIVLNNLSNSFTMQIQLMKLTRKFDTRIEPHPFDAADFNSSNPFAKEILSKGIPVV